MEHEISDDDSNVEMNQNEELPVKTEEMEISDVFFTEQNEEDPLESEDETEKAEREQQLLKRKRVMNRDFLREFINLYRDLPCLWKIKSKEYMDRNKKKKAYNLLIEKIRTVEPEADKQTVINKINTLRGGFRREYNKWKKYNKSGNDVYIPHLWYYDLLLFTKDQRKPRQFPANVDENKDSDIEEINNSSKIYKNIDPISTENIVSSKSMSCWQPQVSKLPERRKLEDQTDEILEIVAERLRNMAKEDQFSVFGKLVAFKLRALPRDTRVHVEKLINDLLFEAELGTLNKFTTIVNSPPPDESDLFGDNRHI